MSASESEPQKRTFVQRCHLNILCPMTSSRIPNTQYTLFTLTILVLFADQCVSPFQLTVVRELTLFRDVVTQAYTELRTQRQVSTMLRVEGIAQATFGSDDESYLSLGPIFAFHRPLPKIISDERDACNHYHVYSAYYPHIPVLITSDAKMASDFIHHGVYGDWTHVPLS
ncbi:hypothetical protein Hypma_005211 [Hypsizygus marmoreus]|uniref:Uncharacterized protein n=1 Tax=Hypsizygus marmoreus TaxID=39966 RepID=A0A369K505_HYPMA|nr:hypothetical protein Hypma_005211 [Hypsizygus marmoreus]